MASLRGHVADPGLDAGTDIDRIDLADAVADIELSGKGGTVRPRAGGEAAGLDLERIGHDRDGHATDPAHRVAIADVVVPLDAALVAQRQSALHAAGRGGHVDSGGEHRIGRDVVAGTDLEQRDLLGLDIGRDRITRSAPRGGGDIIVGAGVLVDHTFRADRLRLKRRRGDRGQCYGARKQGYDTHGHTSYP